MVPKVKNLTNLRSAPVRVFWVLALCLPWLFSRTAADTDIISSFRNQQPASQKVSAERVGELIQLAGGETFSQVIRVDSQQYLNITVIRYGIDLTITLLNSDGKVLISKQSRGVMYGPLHTYLVGRHGQVYSIRVTSNNKKRASGSFSLSVDKRPINTEDAVRLSAQHAQQLGENKLARRELLTATRQFESARKLWQTVNDPLEQGLSLYRLGETQSFLGDTLKSQETFKEALVLFRLASARFEEARTLINLGSLHCELGRTNLALETLNQALELSRSVDDYQAEAMTLQRLGTVHERLGDLQSALSLLQQSLAISSDINDPQLVGPVLLETAEVYSSLGQHQTALTFLLQARDEVRNDSLVDLSALVLIAENHLSLGHRAEALDFLSTAQQKARNVGHNRMKALTLHRLGMVYAELGELTKALEFYSDALMIARQSNNQRLEYRILNSLGLLYYSEGRLDSAENALGSAWALAQAAKDFAYEPNILYSLAKVKRKQGELVGSKHLIEKSLELIDLQRDNIVSSDLRSSYFTSVRSHYEFYIDLLMELNKQNPQNGFDAIAFLASERAHGQSLLELLSEASLDRKHVNPTLLEREQELRAQLSAKISDQLRTLEKKNDSKNSLDTDIQQLMVEYEQTQVQIKLQTPGYRTLTQDKRLVLKDLQDQLEDDNTLLLEYVLGEERSYLFAVTRQSINSYELPERARIEQLARTVHELLIAPKAMSERFEPSSEQRLASSQERYWKEALALSQTLLGPVVSQMAGKRLLIVSDGALQNIPFGALPIPSPNVGQQPLVFRHEIVNLPSASILIKLKEAALRRKPIAGSVAILADPVFDSGDPRVSRDEPNYDTKPRGSFQRLYGSKLEAEQILAMSPATSEMLVGFDANRNAVINGSLENYQIVHFATHGVIDADPALSSIVLSLVDSHGNAQNGILLGRDIANIDLSADLVVLSACETGNGEGISAMTSSFFYAGSQSVMTSLWAVEDKATADLMARFYEGMWRKGMTPAEALRQAQIEMLKDPRWQHPYYWAAFTLQGNGNISIRMNENIKTSPAAVDTLALGIGLLGVAGAIRRRVRRY
jgi:Uncharacterized protein conserved in bacteria